VLGCDVNSCNCYDTVEHVMITCLHGDSKVSLLLYAAHCVTQTTAVQACYAASGRQSQLQALICWHAWRTVTLRRRKWKWLLYHHKRTAGHHIMRTVLRAW
jgi:hypothetical protein